MARRGRPAGSPGVGEPLPGGRQALVPGASAVTRVLLAALAFLACAAAEACAAGAGDRPGAPRMLFTGDILLARQVAREIEARGRMTPWRDMGDRLQQAEFVFGNLEGAVGDAGDCKEPTELCFAVSPRL